MHACVGDLADAAWTAAYLLCDRVDHVDPTPLAPGPELHEELTRLALFDLTWIPSTTGARVALARIGPMFPGVVGIEAEVAEIAVIGRIGIVVGGRMQAVVALIGLEAALGDMHADDRFRIDAEALHALLVQEAAARPSAAGRSWLSTLRRPLPSGTPPAWMALSSTVPWTAGPSSSPVITKLMVPASCGISRMAATMAAIAPFMSTAPRP